MFKKTTSAKKVRYKSNKRKDDFFKDLKGRVDNYFTTNNKSKFADGRMVFKTVFVILAWIITYSLLITFDSHSTNYWVLMGLYCLLGFVNIFIAFAIVHDACHNAYSSKRKINKLLGYSMNFIGGNSYLFTKMHNAHHAFVNIHGIDVTLESHGLFRFTPHEPFQWFHKYQHIYTPIIYMIASLHWTIVKDFKWFFIEDSIGNQKDLNHPREEFWILILTKILYFSYALFIPMLVLSVPIWLIILGFLIMHIPSSLTFALIFQVTHIYDGTHYPLPDDGGNIENNYALHVLETTCDFSRNRSIGTWLMGGINLHVIHHLFPRICHIHYKPLTEIVKTCAEEYGITYYEQPGFFSAFMQHMRMLIHLRKPDAQVPQYGKSVVFN